MFTAHWVREYHLLLISCSKTTKPYKTCPLTMPDWLQHLKLVAFIIDNTKKLASVGVVIHQPWPDNFTETPRPPGMANLVGYLGPFSLSQRVAVMISEVVKFEPEVPVVGETINMKHVWQEWRVPDCCSIGKRLLCHQVEQLSVVERQEKNWKMYLEPKSTMRLSYSTGDLLDW